MNIDKYLGELDSESSDKMRFIWNDLLQNHFDTKGSSGNHQNYFGGYFYHIHDVLRNGMMLYDNLSDQGDLPFTKSDVFLTIFFHDIEKICKYSENNTIDCANLSNSEIRQKMYSKYDVDLPIHILEAIKYIHGEGKYYTKGKRVMSPLSALCHCADIISARIFFE
jgi:hypothetical protein